MKAMIFAAGLGTRLKPLTGSIPKALVEFRGKTLLEHVISKLKDSGFNELVINVHHFADNVESYLEEKDNFGIHIDISDERSLLLDTGGAVLHAKSYLKDSDLILIHNVDIISDIDLQAMMHQHTSSSSLATLAVQSRASSRKLVFNEDNFLCQWKDTDRSEIKIARESKKELSEWSFSGIHVINPDLLDLITETGKFSIIDLYLRLAKDHKISYHETDHSYWFDIGSIEKMKKAESFFESI